MSGEIKHSWNGTVLTITSDSGTSSADLKGEKGDMGIRGPQGYADITTITPLFANSVEECVDTKQVYVLPNNYIYVYKSKTNYIPQITIEGAEDCYIETHGGITQNDSCACKYTNIIPVIEGEQFSYMGLGEYSTASVLWLDNSKNVISYEQYNAKTEAVIVTVPAGVAYVQFASYDGNNKTADAVVLEVAWVLYKQETVISEWENTGIAFVANDYEERVSRMEDSYIAQTEELEAAKEQLNELDNKVTGIANDYIDFETEIGAVVHTTSHSANLFNKNDETIQKGGFINWQNTFVAVTDLFVSHKIPVKANASYIMPYTNGIGGGGAVGHIYDEKDNWLQMITNQVSSDGAYYILVIPDDTTISYMLVNHRIADLDTMMVIEGDTYPAKYIEYDEGGEKLLSNDIQLNETHLNQVESMVEPNPLKGKKIALNGDSICAGAGYVGGYGKIIAENNSMTYQNIGVGGGTITAEQYSASTGNARHWISRTIGNMDSDADYAIVEGGVNDASLGVPMGAISSGYNNTLDDTTFIGAFESMLKQLVIRFAGKKVGYIAVHKMTDNYLSTNSKDDNTSYYWAAKKCCEKWGVPFLDLNISTPAFGRFFSGDVMELRNSYTKDGDGWHPNEAGYKAYYVPKIEAWLKTL